MTYRVELIHSDEGYAVSCPSLPGCWSQGETEAEALANIQAAITDYIESHPSSERQPDVRYVVVAEPSQPSSAHSFRVQPFADLEWPEEMQKTHSVAAWLAHLDESDEHYTPCS